MARRLRARVGAPRHDHAHRHQRRARRRDRAHRRRTPPTCSATAARSPTSTCSPSGRASSATSSPPSPRRRASRRAPPRPSSTSSTTSCRPSSTRSTRSPTVRPLVHEQHAISDNDAAYFDLRPQPDTNICHRFRIRTGDVAEGFAQADVVVEETFRTPSAQHAPMEPHATLAALDRRRPPGGVDRHADPVQRAHGPGRHLRHRRGARADRLPADGRLVRGQDVRAPGGDRGRAGPQGAAPGQGGARPRRGVADAQPPSGGGQGPHRRHSATARWWPRSSTAGSTRAPTPTAGRASRRRWATPASGPTGSPTCASTARASTPTCRPTAPTAATARCSRCGPRSGRWTCWPASWA